MPESGEKASQNLSIFLIKEGISSFEEIIDDSLDIKKYDINYDGNHIGRLFIKNKKPKLPRWASFFSTSIDIKEIGSVATASAVLIVNNDSKLFAFTFGQGRYLLVTDCWEERFGLKVTLNCIDENKVRCIDKKTLDAIAKLSREQASMEVSPQDFGLDIEQDLLRAVTGKPVRAAYGSRMSGMDSLHVTVKADIGDVPDLVSMYYKKYTEDSYKSKFPWIDQIAEVNDKSLISVLDAKLIEEIKNNSSTKIWLTVPEIINWQDVSGFRYGFGSKKPEYSDIQLNHFLKSLKNTKEINIDILKKRKVYCVDSDGETRHKWLIYKCIYCEIGVDGDTYTLNNGKWYKIATDFVNVVNNSYKNMEKYNKLPVCNSNSEGEYNEEVAKNEPDNYALMDRKIILHGGGYSRFEFCDLYSAGKDIIHIKKYGSSSVLSHLFAQGVNSAELFQTDASFRDKVNSKFPSKYRLRDTSKRPEYGEYRIVYAIISERDGDLELPFFSKLSLRNACRRLDGFGYKVALSKIEVSDDIRKKKKYRNTAKR